MRNAPFFSCAKAAVTTSKSCVFSSHSSVKAQQHLTLRPWTDQIKQDTLLHDPKSLKRNHT